MNIKKIIRKILSIDDCKIWSPNWFGFIFSISLGIGSVAVNNIRNNFYVPLYNALAITDSSITYPFMMIFLSNFLSYFIGWIIIFTCTYIGSESRKNNFIANLPIRCANLSQKINYDQYYIVEYFYNGVYNIAYGIANSAFFLYKMLKEVKDSQAILVTIAITILFILVSIGALFLNKIFEYSYTKQYGKLMTFFDTLSKQNIVRTHVNYKFLNKNYCILYKSLIGKMLTPNILVWINTSLAPMAYIIFWRPYKSGNYTYGEFMSITNMFSNIIFAVALLTDGLVYFGKFIGLNESLKNIKINNPRSIGENLSINAKVFFENENSNITLEYNLLLEEIVSKNSKYYLYGANGLGKTVFTQIFNITNNNLENEILELILPKNTIIIPEQANILMIDLEKIDYKQFLRNFENLQNIKEANINFTNNLDKDYNDAKYLIDYFGKFNGAKKWKIIAAYALLFEFVIWDDPFWGIEDQGVAFDYFCNNVKSCLILGAKKDGLPNVLVKQYLNSYLNKKIKKIKIT